MLGRFRLFGLSACRSLCVGGLDGLDRDELNCEQLTDACNIPGAGWAGQQAVVTDTMEALRQHVHQEAADELVGIERHHPYRCGPSRRLAFHLKVTLLLSLTKQLPLEIATLLVLAAR